MRSITWLETRAGNQRTCSRAVFRSSEGQTGAAAMTSILLKSRPASLAPSRTKPRHQSIKSGSANWRITPSPMRPAVRRALGPYPATQTRGISPLVQGNFVGTPSRSTVLPAFRLRKMRTNSSRFSRLVGFLPRTRRELSTRPMPSSIRPWAARFSVAERLAETGTSRTAGVGTQGAGGLFFVVGVGKGAGGGEGRYRGGAGHLKKKKKKRDRQV